MSETAECKCGKTYTVYRQNGIVTSSKCPQCVFNSKLNKKKKSPTFFKTSFNTPQRTRKRVEKDLDDAWSYLVKLIAGMKCERCGSEKALNSHHIFSRRKKSTRWNIKNGICLCVSCHIGSDDSAHKAPRIFMRWLETYRNPKELDLVEKTYSTTCKYEIFELEIILIKLKDEIHRLEKQ